MRYALKAVDASQQVVALELEVSDESAARHAARERGLVVLSLARSSRLARGLGDRTGRFPAQLFSIELLALLDAGLNVVEALQTLAEKEPRGNHRAVLERLLASLRQGESLSQALARAPEAFPELYVATIRASERSGSIAAALRRHVAYLESIDRVRKRVIAALLYPAILTLVGGLVLTFLLLYVVPRFARVYEDLSSDLPFFSALLLALGRWIENHGAVAVFLIGITLIYCVASLARPEVRARWLGRLWRVPAVGDRLKTYQLARLYRTAGMLLQAGIPALKALEMCRPLLAAALHARLTAALAALGEGRRISIALADSGLATPVARRLVAVGERSGRLGELMERVAQFHDEETAREVDAFVRVFEPVLMAALGLGIGLIVVLMYMPVFELAGSLQ